MYRKIFDNTKSASKRLKSPRILKTEADSKYQYTDLQSQLQTQLLISNYLKTRKQIETTTNKRNVSEHYETKTLKKQHNINKSLQGKQVNYNCFLDGCLRKNQQVPKIPIRSRKQLWHNYINSESSVPERRVQSQLNLNKIEEFNNKYRSTSSICSIDSQNNRIQYKLQFAQRSRQGRLISNPNKTNQDVAYYETQFIDGVNLFFVCDGHGINGHLVSNYVKQLLPQLLKSDKLVFMQTKEALIKTINYIAQKVNQENFETQFSGTTLNGVLIYDYGKLLCWNIGDSRSVMGKYTCNGKYRAVPLSRDHKPNLQKEHLRIKQSGGRIDTYHDEDGNPIGPLRVWVNGAQYPGLAMSRSIGDQVAQSVGVNSTPEIFEISLNCSDKFIIIATDGIWEFLDSQTVIDIIGKYYQKNDIEGASDELMRIALRMWTMDDDSVIDDITFIIIFIYN